MDTRSYLRPLDALTRVNALVDLATGAASLAILAALLLRWS